MDRKIAEQTLHELDCKVATSRDLEASCKTHIGVVKVKQVRWGFSHRHRYYLDDVVISRIALLRKLEK